MRLTRRKLLITLAALPASRGLAQARAALRSKVYRFENLPVRERAGNRFRPVLEGMTSGGSHLEVHESDLAPGAMPHPAHHHPHEEMFLVREGTVEVTISGQSFRLGPGSVAYVAGGDEHAIRNPGPARARYFVMALGKRD
jgi:mannose-6-phosphate isomerase-like protein (cupin superfamily)